MTAKTDRFYVQLGASQARRRLKGHGFGVKKVETAGNNRSVIIHTATGKHLRQLESLFHDVIEVKSENNDN
jgi:DNA transformation protein